jgi:hypothetical protein
MKKFSIIFVLLFSSGLSAQTYKCIKDGKTVYSGLPCDTQSADKMFKEINAGKVQKTPESNEYKYISEAPAVLPPAPIQVKPVASHADRYAWSWRDLDWEIILIIGVFYFIPSFIAFGRKHHNGAAIVLLNLLLGWTALGWIAALVWSATAVKRPEQKQQFVG